VKEDTKPAFSVKSVGYVSRTGYNPSKPQKVNQDAFIIIKNFNNTKGNWLFGVCDGHGSNGHMASDFVKINLPGKILKAENEFKESVRKGLSEANKY
jgi:serine/threonine protein phosphatase PrpC